MAIPDFQTLMLPVLKAATSDIHVSDVIEQLAVSLNFTADEREQLQASGTQTTFSNRVQWAKSYLAKAGLVDKTGRGRFKITPTGLGVLKNPPERIDIKFLRQFPAYAEYKPTKGNEASKSLSQSDTEFGQPLALAPDEAIRAARDEIEGSLSSELLASVRAKHASFFERLVVKLLVAMGYGGTLEEAGRAIGQSGDGGIDEVIDEDALGLDRIYVQAKRYADGNQVGPGAIRDFFGALDQVKASKGIFVTTSGFSKSARDTAANLSKRIVLIDGAKLAELMMRFDVGCRVVEIVPIKKIDEEFFEG